MALPESAHQILANLSASSHAAGPSGQGAAGLRQGNAVPAQALAPLKAAFVPPISRFVGNSGLSLRLEGDHAGPASAVIHLPGETK